MSESVAQAELDELRRTVRGVVADLGGTGVVRRIAADGPGYDEKAWDVIARQVGLACLGLPESAGGMGGLAEVAVVCEELGTALLPVPFWSSTAYAGALLAACGEPAAGLLADLAGGAVVGVAVLDADGAWRPDALVVREDGGLLTGSVGAVVDGLGATHLVVAARTAAGVDLFAVDAADAVRTPVGTLDLSRAQARVGLDGAPATPLTSGGRAADAVAPALAYAGIALAAEQLGGAQAALDLTVAYVRQRRQFGRSIGSFQAVKHTCADLLVLVEGCRSAVVRAVAAAAGPARAEASAVAAAYCSDAFRTVTAEAVQLHGGIGFTWEHDAHLYFRRARADAVLLGGAAAHRERLATLLAW